MASTSTANTDEGWFSSDITITLLQQHFTLLRSHSVYDTNVHACIEYVEVITLEARGLRRTKRKDNLILFRKAKIFPQQYFGL